MSVKRNGIFKGKRGNTVTYMLNGQEVQREIGVRTSAPTKPDLIKRKKMKMVNDLHQPLKEFLATGFRLQGQLKRTTAYAMAVSHNITHAITGSYPQLEFDYDKVLFSKGELPVNSEAKVELKDSELAFSWDPLLLEKGMKRNDTVLMLAYCPEKHSAFFQLSGNRRTVGKDVLEVTAYHQQVTLEVYVAFVSADRKSISNSVHIGQVKLTEY